MDATGTPAPKFVWIPEAPHAVNPVTKLGAPVYAADPAKGTPAGRLCVGTFDAHEALHFESEGACRAWCSTWNEEHPESPFEPREHGFL